MMESPDSAPLPKPRGIAGNQTPAAANSDEWITPPHIIKALGPFDLDPCASENFRHEGITQQWTPDHEGWSRPWEGCVWLNPPYGKQAKIWLERLSDHGNGIALIFARTDTDLFFAEVWEQADAVLFLRGRLRFLYPDGSPAPHNGGAPSVLVAYGPQAVAKLKASGLPGKLIQLKP